MYVSAGCAVEALSMILQASRLSDAVEAWVRIAGLNQFQDLGSGFAKGDVGQPSSMSANNDPRSFEQADLFLYWERARNHTREPVGLQQAFDLFFICDRAV